METLQHHDWQHRAEHGCPPCHQRACQLPPLLVRGYLDALCVERLEGKTERTLSLLRRFGGDWDRVLFVTLARSFGFGQNGDAFEQWAANIPLTAVGHHRDNLFQIRAVFFGQAGLLGEAFQARMQPIAGDELPRLQGEYRYLAHKFGLTPMPGEAWTFRRMRPQNYPTVRIDQLCALYYHRLTGLSAFVEAKSLEAMRRLFLLPAADGGKPKPLLGKGALDTVILNTVVPTLFAYGQYQRKESLRELALALLCQLPAEQNHVTKLWADLGLEIQHAGDSQALLQLRTRYCDPGECSRCRFQLK